MSNGSGGNGGNPPATPTIKVDSYDIGPPDQLTDIPRKFIDNYYRDTFNILKQYCVPGWLAAPIAGTIIAIPTYVVMVCHLSILLAKPFLPSLFGSVLEVLDDLRKTLDPVFASFSVAVLNELLGTDFTVAHLPQGDNIAAHLARAEEIGFLFHKQLLSEFLAGAGLSLDPTTSTFNEVSGPTGAGELISPLSGVRAAARFSGLAINFGTATGIIATIGGLVPFEHLDEIREIGEQVAKNLGLGRLQRLALAPIVQILLAEPYKWFINEIARPTQLGLGEVVNPYSGAVMKPELVWRDLARAGYSDDKIQAVLDLHRKKLSEGDLFSLFKGGYYDLPTVTAGLKHLGYTDTDAQTKAEIDQFDARKPLEDEFRSAIVTAYADGHIDRSELETLVKGIALTPDEQALVLVIADYKRKVPNKHLTLAELQSAFENAILDVNEFTDYLTRLGYSSDDQNTLLLLTLIKLGQLEAAAAAKKKKAAGKKPPAGGTPPAPAPAPGG